MHNAHEINPTGCSREESSSYVIERKLSGITVWCDLMFLYLHRTVDFRQAELPQMNRPADTWYVLRRIFFMPSDRA